MYARERVEGYACENMSGEGIECHRNTAHLDEKSAEKFDRLPCGDSAGFGPDLLCFVVILCNGA